jgi:hypothetical protein
MVRRTIAVLCFVPLMAAAGAAGAPFVQDQAHYEQAVSAMSTAPYFVLVTLVDDTKNKSWTGCVPANVVMGAIHIELGVGYDAPAIERVRTVMLTTNDRAFHFANPQALANLPMNTYTPADLDRARAYLRAHGTQFLLSSDWDKIDAANKLNRPALACAIIEKGLAARMADGNAETYAEP